jgi:hypothetical protein
VDHANDAPAGAAAPRKAPQHDAEAHQERLGSVVPARNPVTRKDISGWIDFQKKIFRPDASK